MRRSGRANNVDVPAFFTRSKAKHFFNSSPSSATKCRNEKKQCNEELEQSTNQITVVKTENKNSPMRQEEVEIGQTEGTNLQLKDSMYMETHNCEITDKSQDSSENFQLVKIKQETELVNTESENKSLKIENLESNGGSRKDVSATIKAINQLEQSFPNKRNVKKKQKIPSILRRRKLNERLQRILMPKSGIIFLHELRPNCTFKIQEKPDSNPPIFTAQVEYEDKIIGVGQGKTKSSAKGAAAENAIKALVSESISQQNIKSANDVNEKEGPKNNSSTSKDEPMDTSDDLPLASLASFAMYKMFSEWQSQGYDFSSLCTQQKKKLPSSKTLSVKKELPPNAENLHPSFLLNTMRPGAISVELERSSKDNVSTVTMGYEIDGIMYRGSGSNKKEARKRAAMVALSSLFGLKYADE